MVDNLKYKRVLLKVSGEALLGDQEFGIDQKPVEMIANEIKIAHDMGAEIAIVVGGGNIFRGMKNSAKLGMDQASVGYCNERNSATKCIEKIKCFLQSPNCNRYG